MSALKLRSYAIPNVSQIGGGSTHARRTFLSRYNSALFIVIIAVPISIDTYCVDTKYY